MTTNILISDAHEPDYYVGELKSRYPDLNVVGYHDDNIPASDLEAAEIIMVRGRTLSKANIDGAKNLKWIQNLITGCDHFFELLADRSDLWLTSGRGIHGPQMSETTFLHMLALSRSIRQLSHNQDAHGWDKPHPTTLNHRTACIVGTGAISSALAARCKAFGMTVHGVTRSKRAIENFDKIFTRDELIDAASQADYLIILTPYDDYTHHFINSNVFNVMKPTAHLVNVSRGGVVDEDALIKALQENRFAGAGLDVFENEPLEPESPLWDMDNVFITPWIGGHSDLYSQQALGVAEPNLKLYLGGHPENMSNIVRRPGSQEHEM